MPFGNPVVGGIQLIRNAIESQGYAPGLTGWIINRDGSSEFNNTGVWKSLEAVNSFTYKGDELSTLLAKAAKGIVAQTSISSAHLPSPAIGATESTLLELDQILFPGRMYQAFLSNMECSATGAPTRAVVRVRYTTDGTAPSTASPRLFETWGDLFTGVAGGGLFTVPGDKSRVFSVASQVNLRLLMTSQNQIVTTGGTQFTHSFIGLDTGTLPIAGPMLAINDLGASVPDTGVYLGGAISTPTPVFKTFATYATDSQSYNSGLAGANGSGSSNTDLMYFGNDPSGFNGNMRSLAYFNKADTGGGNGLGSLNDMSGVAAGNVSYLDVWVQTPWWYQVAGGTLLLGWTASAMNHASWPGGTADVVESGYSGRGDGHWFSILGSAIATGILGGTFLGIQLGPGKDASNAWYGYAYGAAHASGGNAPAIRGGYYK